VGHDFDRLTAHQNPGEATPTVRRHDDEIACLCFRSLNNAIGRILVLHVYGFASHPVFCCCLAGGSKNFFGARFDGLLIIDNERGIYRFAADNRCQGLCSL